MTDLRKLFDYPPTRVEKVTNRHHGRELVDPYRWLEDSDSPEVQAWADAQTAFTARTIGEHAKPETFRAELEKLFDRDSIGLPDYREGWYYRYIRRAGQNQAAFCRSRELDGDLEVLIDPNGRREDDAISLTETAVSPHGAYLAYAMSEAGSEMNVIRVRSLETGADLPDEIPHSRDPQITWLADESGFFYSRNPEPGTVDKHDEQYYAVVYLHRLGEDWRQDEAIFGQGRHKEDRYGLSLSDDRRTLIIESSRDWSQDCVHLYDVESKALITVVENNGSLHSAQVVRGRVYVWTDHRAEFGKVLAAKLAEAGRMPIEDWEVFIPERQYALQSVNFTATSIIVDYLRDACSYAEALDLNGQLVRELPLPAFSSLGGLSCDYEEAEFYYSVTGFTLPDVQYKWDAAAGTEPIEIRRVEGLIDPDDYQVTQEWATSPDGVKVPMFIVRPLRAKLDGSNPTVLYGYGGFNLSETPVFMASLVPFLARGGVLVTANIRGGGEFGKTWHQGGMLANKQRSFDDFIACAKHLASRGYSSPGKLAIYGGSNGGLLVGVCAMQAPELFRAVVCSVPLLDMVRFPHFLIASRWMSEYGDPSIKEHFDWIINWSPYHNFDVSRQYPAMLFMTADHDTRVEPLHARKMTALMQSGTSRQPVLIRVEKEAGHGSGTPLSKWVDERADILAFLSWQLEF